MSRSLSHLNSAFAALTLLTAASASDDSERSADWQAADRDADATVWRNAESGAEYTEFASGLNYYAEGEWRSAPREEIVLLPDGAAAAVQGQSRVIFAPDLNTAVEQWSSRDLLQSENDGVVSILLTFVSSVD